MNRDDLIERTMKQYDNTVRLISEASIVATAFTVGYGVSESLSILEISFVFALSIIAGRAAAWIARFGFLIVALIAVSREERSKS